MMVRLFLAAFCAALLGWSPAMAADAAQAARARACGVDAARIAMSERLQPALSRFDRDVRFASRGAGGFRVQVFSDYSCPSCKAWNPVLRQFAQENPDVRIDAVEYPIYGRTLTSTVTGNRTLDASRLGIAAQAKGPERYFRFHDALMADRGGVSGADIAAAAKAAGLELADLQRAGAAPQTEAALQANLAFARAIEARGTPVLIADGVFLSPGVDGRESLHCLLAAWRKAAPARSSAGG